MTDQITITVVTVTCVAHTGEAETGTDYVSEGQTTLQEAIDTATAIAADAFERHVGGAIVRTIVNVNSFKLPKPPVTTITADLPEVPEGETSTATATIS